MLYKGSMDAMAAQSLGQRLRQARKAMTGRVTLQDVADAMGVTVQAVSAWERDRDQPKLHRLSKLADILHVDVNWLLAAHDDFPVRGTVHVPLPDREIGRDVPVIDRVQAGHLTIITDPYPVGEGKDILHTSAPLSDLAFALEIEGDSMAPLFQPGDKVIIDPSVQPRPGDFVVAKLADENEATFKKYRQRGVDADGNAIFELVALNDDYATIIVDSRNPGRVVGTMIEHRHYRRP